MPTAIALFAWQPLHGQCVANDSTDFTTGQTPGVSTADFDFLANG